MKKLLLQLITVLVSFLLTLLKATILLRIITLFNISYLKEFSFYQIVGIICFLSILEVNKRKVLKAIKETKKIQTKNYYKDVFLKNIEAQLISVFVIISMYLFSVLFSIILKQLV